MRMYKEYPYNGWQNHVAELKNFLEEKNFKYLDGSLEEKNFIIVMDHEDINKYVPNLINFFKNNNLSTSCIMLHGSCNTSDPPLNLHIDKIPLMEKFYYSPYYQFAKKAIYRKGKKIEIEKKKYLLSF